jgi:hypothetical protein
MDDISPKRLRTTASLRQVAVVSGAMVICSAVAVACNIPVFRFALERWKPDSCEVVVFHKSTMAGDDEKFVGELEAASLAKDGDANLNVIRCDLNTNTDQEFNELWLAISEKTDAKLPMLVARSLKGRGKTINHWHGSLKDARAAELLQSPIRTELSKRLQSGDAIVWLVINSSDEKRTAAAKELLSQQCKKLPGKIELPEGIGLPGSELYSEVPLLLQFSILEMDASDPKEQYLVRQLTGFQTEAFAAGEPLIVPVFGRGRSLEVIPGSQLTGELIHDLTEFLCGACSCQVKEQNPGFDLLLSTNWNVALFGEDSEGPPSEAAEGSGQKKRPELVPIPSGKKR